MNYAIQLNDRQRLIVKVLCGYLALCTLFPPFYASYPGGGTIGFGFHFLLSPPDKGRIDTAQLLFQWLPAVFIATVAVLLGGPLRSESPPQAPQDLKGVGASIDRLWEGSSKTAFDIETERLRINELAGRMESMERAARLWQGLISQNIVLNPNQKDLL